MSGSSKRTGKTSAGSSAKEVRSEATADDDTSNGRKDDNEESSRYSIANSSVLSSSASSPSSLSGGCRAVLSSSQKVVSELKSLYSDYIKKIEAEQCVILMVWVCCLSIYTDWIMNFYLAFNRYMITLAIGIRRD